MKAKHLTPDQVGSATLPGGLWLRHCPITRRNVFDAVALKLGGNGRVAGALILLHDVSKLTRTEGLPGDLSPGRAGRKLLCHGILCSGCGSEDVRVLSTQRLRRDGTRRRRVECQSCGAGFVHVEHRVGGKAAEEGE